MVTDDRGPVKIKRERPFGQAKQVTVDIMYHNQGW